jgi:uncharacterized protein (DUF1499 family)
LAHVGAAPALAGFGLFALGGLLGITAAAIGIVSGVRGRATWGAVVPAAAIAVWFLVVAIGSRGYPPINDISSDLARPPQFVHAGTLPANQGRDMQHPGDSFAQQQHSGYPTLANKSVAKPIDAAYRDVLQSARAMPGWEITREDAAARTIEGIDTTWLFRFQDDFVIEVRPQGEGSEIAMRSKSRDGRGDIGANARRIEAFFATLK